MKRLLTIALLFESLLSYSQVIPEILKVDNYRPYLTESQLKEELFKENDSGFPRTSKELYPENYKYVNQDWLGPIKGTNADPANAIPNYTQPQVNQPSVTSNILPPSAYDNQLSIQQRNMAIYEADFAAYKAKRQLEAKRIDDAVKASYRPSIRYNLGIHNGDYADRFETAYNHLNAMLTGQEEIDFARAVFLIESAYDQSLTEEEFYDMFDFSKTVIERLIIQDGLDPNDNMAKIMSTFKFMADTTEVYFAEEEKPIVTKPMLYDYDDYAAKKDASKVFVSKLLRTGSGQCMSLPMLYFILSKSIGAEGVHMALAPQHSFVTFKDRLGNWNNIELTGRMFTTDDFQWQGGFVKANQVKSKIYLHPLSDKETLAYLMTTLALTYIKTFGTDDFAMNMALTAKDHFPNSLTANMIIAGYYKDLFNHVLRQYRLYNLTQKDLDLDKNAQTIDRLRNEARDHVYKNLGYAKIPDWAYEAWLEGVNELANKKQHLVRRRQLEQQLNR